MNLIDILNREMIWPDLESTDKVGVIGELASKIAASLQSINGDKLTKILSEREELGSTGIQDGIAIPHGKVDGLEKIIVACGRSVKGIDFDAHDAKPTHLFFVLLAPSSASGQHLKVLARLSRLLKDAHFRERLIHASDADTMYKIITSEDEKL